MGYAEFNLLLLDFVRASRRLPHSPAFSVRDDKMGRECGKIVD